MLLKSRVIQVFEDAYAFDLYDTELDTTVFADLNNSRSKQNKTLEFSLWTDCCLDLIVLKFQGNRTYIEGDKKFTF